MYKRHSFIYDNKAQGFKSLQRFNPTDSRHANCKFVYFDDGEDCGVLLVLPSEGEHSDMFSRVNTLFVANILILRDNHQVSDRIVTLVKRPQPIGGGEVKDCVVTSWSADSMNVYLTPEEYRENIMQGLGINSYV